MGHGTGAAAVMQEMGGAINYEEDIAGFEAMRTAIVGFSDGYGPRKHNVVRNNAWCRRRIVETPRRAQKATMVQGPGYRGQIH